MKIELLLKTLVQLTELKVRTTATASYPIERQIDFIRKLIREELKK